MFADKSNRLLALLPAALAGARAVRAGRSLPGAAEAAELCGAPRHPFPGWGGWPAASPPAAGRRRQPSRLLRAQQKQAPLSSEQPAKTKRWGSGLAPSQPSYFPSVLSPFTLTARGGGHKLAGSPAARSRGGWANAAQPGPRSSPPAPAHPAMPRKQSPLSRTQKACKIMII